MTIDSMKKKRGNPNWGKLVVQSAADVQPSLFEQIVRKRRLSPTSILVSIQLKEWVRKNKDQKYVPSDLLKASDFEAASDL
jgi:hypothetical protein